MIVALWRLRWGRWRPLVRWRFFEGRGGGAKGATKRDEEEETVE